MPKLEADRGRPQQIQTVLAYQLPRRVLAPPELARLQQQ